MITETYIKFWPAEYHSQSAIDAALQLRPRDRRRPQRSQAIDIHTFDAAVDIIGKDPEKWRPEDRETADHSLPYCTAVALADGDVTLTPSSSGALHRPGACSALVAKVKVHRDAGARRPLPARHPEPHDQP